MKKTGAKVLKWILIVVILCGLGYGGYIAYDHFFASSADTQTSSYTPVSVTTGDLNQEVISTGALSIAQTEDVLSPSAIKVANVLVQQGQTIAVGDALATVDETELDAAITTLRTEIETVDSTLVSLASAYSDSQNITNTAEGRVKVVYAKVGDFVQDVVDEYGALYVLSLDGKMRVSVPTNGFININDTVSVTYGERRYTGTVVNIEGDMINVTFSDATVLPSEEVKVLSNGVLLGAGNAAINMPLNVSSTVNGYISSANITVNTTFSRRASMFTVVNVALSKEYEDALAQRDELLQEIALLRALKADPTIYSTFSGIVSTINASRNQTVAKDDVLLTMYVGEPNQMIVSVDELDIINLKIGQTATVVMDALTNKTYDATVEYISQIGTASGGITNYSVNIKLNADDQLKLGMNGTVTINLGSTQNALLVPLAALQSDAQGTYVWLYQEGYQATDEAPGVKTYITTGLSNEDYAAVLSGLSLGDQVLVVRSATTTSTREGTGAFSMMNVDMGGAQAMPSGVTAPGGMGTFTGGGNRENGGGMNRGN